MIEYKTLTELIIHCAEIGTKIVEVTFKPIQIDNWPESIRNNHNVIRMAKEPKVETFHIINECHLLAWVIHNRDKSHYDTIKPIKQ